MLYCAQVANRHEILKPLRNPFHKMTEVPFLKELYRVPHVRVICDATYAGVRLLTREFPDNTVSRDMVYQKVPRRH